MDRRGARRVACRATRRRRTGDAGRRARIAGRSSSRTPGRAAARPAHRRRFHHQPPGRDEHRATPRVPRRQHAVDHVHAALDGFDDVHRVAHAHQIARPVGGKHRGSRARPSSATTRVPSPTHSPPSANPSNGIAPRRSKQRAARPPSVPPWLMPKSAMLPRPAARNRSRRQAASRPRHRAIDRLADARDRRRHSTNSSSDIAMSLPSPSWIRIDDSGVIRARCRPGAIGTPRPRR